MHLPKDKAFEYILDRKNEDIKKLEDLIDELRVERHKHDGMVIAAEVFLFFFGVFVGAMLMKAYGWRML